MMEQLSDTFCCLAPDLPGHGQTRVDGPPNLYSMENTAIALLNLLDQLQIPQCFLVGYSMGGRVALYLAIHFANRFPKVVLESASPGLRTQPERWERIQRDQALAAQLEADFPTFLHHWYNQPLFESLRQRAEFENLLTRRLQNQPQTLAQSLRYLSTGQQPSLWEALENHAQPLLLLAGEHDRKFRAIGQHMVEQCPSAQLQVVSSCGHVIHLEYPEEFTERVRKFLQGL